MDVRAKQRLCYERFLVNSKLRVRGFAPRHLKRSASSRFIRDNMKMNRIKYLYKFFVAIILFNFLASCATQSVRHNGNSEANLQAQRQSETNMQTNAEDNEPPFACNMKAMTAEQRQRYNALTKQLQIAKQEVKELPNGYAFRLPSEDSSVKDAAEWITYERLCCPFFDFGLETERNGGAMWLRLTGREGVKPVIRSEFGI